MNVRTPPTKPARLDASPETPDAILVATNAPIAPANNLTAHSESAAYPASFDTADNTPSNGTKIAAPASFPNNATNGPNCFAASPISDPKLDNASANGTPIAVARSEEHTSELQSRGHL